MEQTVHQDLHSDGFLDWIEQSPQQKEFGAYFKKCLAENGVDFQTLDTKNFQITVDEREFDPPAPPRPDSPAWAYLYGNRLVEFACMDNFLTPETEYKRGIFSVSIEPLQRKMKVFYGHLDWRSKLSAKKKEWESAKMTEFQRCKAEVAAKAVSTDVDGFMELFRSNSHFQFGDDDPYHHYMPKENEDKWIAYQKFQWDQTASNADTAFYGTKLAPLMAAADSGLGKSQFKAAVLSALKSTDFATSSQVVSAFAKASPSSTGPEASDEEKLAAVFNLVGAKDKLNAAQANALSSMLRGGVSGVDLNGKSLAEATEILKDTADEKAVSSYYMASNISATVEKVNAGQLLVGLAFGNVPDLFAGLFLTPTNMDDFVGANNSAFSEFTASLESLNKTTADLGKALADACSKADAGLQKAGLSKAGAGDMLMASGLQAAAGSPVTPASLFLVPKLNDMAAHLASTSFMGAVNCGAAAKYLETEQFTSSVWNSVASAALMPSASGLSGPVLNAVGQAACDSAFAENVSNSVSEFLVASGKVSVPSREMTSAVEDAFAGVTTAAEAVKTAQEQAAAKFMALTLDTGLADLGSLEVQYKC